MRVLIAEDDGVSRLILEKALRKSGHECLAARDGAEAWELYRREDVDVIISDWMMPEMDGLELCRRVREHESSRDGYTYFVFLTALGEKEHLLEGIRSGADDYLTKPLDREELQVRLIAASRVTSLHRRLSEQKEQLRRLNLQLFAQARRDPLTQLGNRLQLREDIEALRGKNRRYGHTFAAVMCDIDHFKPYNDLYGHLRGDEVLRAIAATIAENCRREDLIYRYGGEEFLIILPEQDLESAVLVAGRLRGAVERLGIPHRANEPPGVVTISAGVAALEADAEREIEDLLREADAALYRAKEAGRNRIAPDP
ncbi:diguanylate cyclase [Rubrobacter taiwanensis]|jgi:two-component system cell cycle response regulator|uniref:Diguanylate cyclase n=1 Tax=Rubrobacter taiwanensis TaxID=185139 RepID=A0A4R1BGR6_9ACTN|nr:diguanylate cyclase [Rubrobacter taiwanensis]TCJ16436.1 diguanylate cyclase [Rubrobacter taiwanensis]